MLPKSNGQHLFRLSYFKNATENVRQREALCLTGRRPPWTTCCDCFGSLAKGVNIETYWSLLARTRCGHHACHPRFLPARESRGGRPLSWLLPVTQCEQIPGQAGGAHPGGRRSCAG